MHILVTCTIKSLFSSFIITGNPPTRIIRSYERKQISNSSEFALRIQISPHNNSSLFSPISTGSNRCEKPLEILTYLKKHTLLLACIYAIQKKSTCESLSFIKTSLYNINLHHCYEIVSPLQVARQKEVRRSVAGQVPGKTRKKARMFIEYGRDGSQEGCHSSHPLQHFLLL